MHQWFFASAGDVFHCHHCAAGIYGACKTVGFEEDIWLFRVAEKPVNSVAESVRNDDRHRHKSAVVFDVRICKLCVDPAGQCRAAWIGILYDTVPDSAV